MTTDQRLYVDYPFKIDQRGRAATTNRNRHIRNLIEQVLFTSPGERVNRPTFGSGVRQLLFAPNSDVLGQTLQVTTQAGLQQWLGSRIELSAVDVTQNDSKIIVTVRYRTTGLEDEVTETFERPL